MVPLWSLVFMSITLVLSLLLPIAFLLILQKGRKGVFSAWVAGALGFIVPQIVIRIPILQALGRSSAYRAFAEDQALLFAFLLALSAGLFETAGRFVVLKFGLAKRLSYTTGLAAGAGHGGIESIALIGLTYINNLVLSVLINTGRLDSLPASGEEAVAALQAAREALVGTAPDLFLMAGFERVFTMVFHMALTVLLTLLIMKKQAILGFFLVTALHFLLDFAAVVMQQNDVPHLLIEGFLLLSALLALVFLLLVRPAFGKHQSIPEDPGEQAAREGY